MTERAMGSNGGWEAFGEAYAEHEVRSAIEKRRIDRIIATGEIPADYHVDLAASSDPALTADQFLALKAAAEKEAAAEKKGGR